MPESPFIVAPAPPADVPPAAPGAELPIVLRGRSIPAERQRRELALAAAASGPVTIVADAGLDAEAVAIALHRHHGEDRPLVRVPCGSTGAEELHERLFGGPERASTRRRDLEAVTAAGAFVAARGGTLLLLDAADLPSGVQRRIVRVLRDGEVYLADERRVERVSVRLVAVVTPDFDGEVTAGRFRGDLHRRLTGRRITLAPLRERPDDMPDLVRALAAEVAARRGDEPLAFTTAALTALASLPWPRNLEELRALVVRLHDAGTGHPARQEDVLQQLAFGRAPAPSVRFDTLKEARKRFERDYIAAVLARHGWRMADAAATLGIERANLYRKVRQLGLTRPANGAS